MNESNQRLIALLSREEIPIERLKPIYNRHGIYVDEGVKTLVDEICLDGSNTIASVFRGLKGIPYDEIVRDVARMFKINLAKNETEMEIEMKIIDKLFNQYIENSEPNEREEIEKIIAEALKQDNTPSLKKILKVSGASITSAHLVSIIAQQVGRKAAANAVTQVTSRFVRKRIAGTVAREFTKRGFSVAGFAVPLLNVALVGWTIMDVAGPAFRKTIPTAVDIALLRLEYEVPALS
jgi:uncharacterized protein YaaW (UPF0174 family)